MFQIFKRKKNEEMTKIHEYCLKDTLLPLDLWKTQYIMQGIIEMSRITFVFLTDLFDRGASFKVLSQLYMFARQRNHVLDALPDWNHLDKYKGATVSNTNIRRKKK